MPSSVVEAFSESLSHHERRVRDTQHYRHTKCPIDEQYKHALERDAVHEAEYASVLGTPLNSGFGKRRWYWDVQPLHPPTWYDAYMPINLPRFMDNRPTQVYVAETLRNFEPTPTVIERRTNAWFVPLLICIFWCVPLVWHVVERSMRDNVLEQAAATMQISPSVTVFCAACMIAAVKILVTRLPWRRRIPLVDVDPQFSYPYRDHDKPSLFMYAVDTLQNWSKLFNFVIFVWEVCYRWTPYFQTIEYSYSPSKTLLANGSLEPYDEQCHMFSSEEDAKKAVWTVFSAWSIALYMTGAVFFSVGIIWSHINHSMVRDQYPANLFNFRTLLNITSAETYDRHMKAFLRNMRVSPCRSIPDVIELQGRVMDYYYVLKLWSKSKLYEQVFSFLALASGKVLWNSVYYAKMYPCFLPRGLYGMLGAHLLQGIMDAWTDELRLLQIAGTCFACVIIIIFACLSSDCLTQSNRCVAVLMGFLLASYIILFEFTTSLIAPYQVVWSIWYALQILLVLIRFIAMVNRDEFIQVRQVDPQTGSPYAESKHQAYCCGATPQAEELISVVLDVQHEVNREIDMTLAAPTMTMYERDNISKSRCDYNQKVSEIRDQIFRYYSEGFLPKF